MINLTLPLTPDQGKTTAKTRALAPKTIIPERKGTRLIYVYPNGMYQWVPVIAWQPKEYMDGDGKLRVWHKPIVATEQYYPYILEFVHKKVPYAWMDSDGWEYTSFESALETVRAEWGD